SKKEYSKVDCRSPCDTYWRDHPRQADETATPHWRLEAVGAAGLGALLVARHDIAPRISGELARGRPSQCNFHQVFIIPPMNVEQKLAELKRRDGLAEDGGGEERRA